MSGCPVISPGFCCEIHTGPWAMGVDDLSNPTITRIPRRCTVTYSGSTGGPGLASEIATWVNSHVHTLEAFSPLYTFGALGIQNGIRPEGYPTYSFTVSNYPCAMHFTTAMEQHVSRPQWPGYVGGTVPLLTDALLPIRAVDGPVTQTISPPNSTMAGVAGVGNPAAIINYGNQLQFATGYPPYNPQQPGFPENSDAQLIRELTIIPGRWADRSGAIVPIDDKAQFLFSGDWGPLGGGLSNAARIWAAYPTVYKYYTVSVGPNITRRQPICVIPDSVTFRPVDVVQAGVMPRLGIGPPNDTDFSNLTVVATFSDWFEGPFADPPS